MYMLKIEKPQKLSEVICLHSLKDKRVVIIVAILLTVIAGRKCKHSSEDIGHVPKTIQRNAKQRVLYLSTRRMIKVAVILVVWMHACQNDITHLESNRRGKVISFVSFNVHLEVIEL